MSDDFNRRKVQAEREWINKYLGSHYTPEELRNIRDHHFEMARELGIADSHDDWRELNDAKTG